MSNSINTSGLLAALDAAKVQLERIYHDEAAPNQDPWTSSSPNAWAPDRVQELYKQLAHYQRIADEAIDAINTALAAAPQAHEGAQPESFKPPKECRHCGWFCAPNAEPSKKWYPLDQREELREAFPGVGITGAQGGGNG